MQRLGGRTTAVATASSSVQKGETLQDTVRTLACYSDAIVLRHPDPASIDIAAKFSPVPIINGGNGSVEHPTQAILDLFTMREELGRVNGVSSLISLGRSKTFGIVTNVICTSFRRLVLLEIAANAQEFA